MLLESSMGIFISTQITLFYLTNKEAKSGDYTVIKHYGHLKGKCKKLEPQAGNFLLSNLLCCSIFMHCMHHVIKTHACQEPAFIS